MAKQDRTQREPFFVFFDFINFIDFLIHFITIFAIKMQYNHIDIIVAAMRSFFRYSSYFSRKLPFLAISRALPITISLPTLCNHSHRIPRIFLIFLRFFPILYEPKWTRTIRVAIWLGLGFLTHLG